ncbi:dipeptide ABC transporter ATP-binding protein [Spirochaetota bacterium]
MNDNEVLLEVKDLRVHFPVEQGIIFKRHIASVRAVDGISFSVKRGEALGLVGESGCGKSTCVMAIARLEKISSGSVMFEGKDLTSLKTDELTRARKDFQIIFQDPYSSLDPRMRAVDIVSQPLKIFVKQGLLSLSKEEIHAKAIDLLERCGLGASYADRYPHEFSGGQRQRIGIARSLALGPKLILADEPVSALDVSIQSQILNLMKDLKKEFGLTFLFIAHDLAVVEYFCDRVAVMYLGTIVELASSTKLYKNPMHPYTKALLSAVPVPNPVAAKKRKRIILSGDVPSPTRIHPGCPFAERCPEVMEVCRHSRPLLKESGEEHQVACFLHE